MRSRPRRSAGSTWPGSNDELYNDATQVALLREGTTTVLSMENNYQGPAEDFAMVVPVPQVLAQDDVKTLPSEIFRKLDKLTAPRLVEYWEKDPCQDTVRFFCSDEPEYVNNTVENGGGWADMGAIPAGNNADPRTTWWWRRSSWWGSTRS